MEDSPQPKFYGREIDYLEDLGAKLRNLKGYATLAHELLQNADDVPGATLCRFNVCDDALIVENDGEFSDCGQLDLQECPWKTDTERGSHRCDFHRFRKVAGADKRNEGSTTGAFGIGFISVYQITDRPEVLSGRHWILDESEEPSKRIAECPGCGRCASLDVGTRFYLPWASDGDSVLRKKLRAESTNDGTSLGILAELQSSISAAMLFLKKISKVELLRNGELVRCIERLVEDDSILLTDGEAENDETWHVFRGNFEDEAERLKSSHGELIEAKRSPEVSIAVRAVQVADGLICATLPTQQKTGLPFHINGDFFPSEDRKKVILEQDYQSDWNRSVLRCAADVFSRSIEDLPRLFKPKHVWTLLKAVKAVEDGSVDASLTGFWGRVQPSVQSAKIVFTTSGAWKQPGEVVYLRQEAEHDAVPVLEGLGLDVVHQDLRPFQNLLISGDVRVSILGIEALLKALVTAGVDQPFSAGEWPEFLQRDRNLNVLWSEIDRLLKKRTTAKASDGNEEVLLGLSRVALAVSKDGTLCPCVDVYVSPDAQTQDLFPRFDPDLEFASEATLAFESLPRLCPQFGIEDAIRAIDGAEPAGIASLFDEGGTSPLDVVAWFEKRRESILDDQDLKASFARLPIFPSGGRYECLDSLSLPGDFEDPLQMASVLDVESFPRFHDFLRDLGIQELGLSVYVALHLVPALARDELSVEKRRAAALLLATRRSEISEEDGIADALRSVACIECFDGDFRAPGEVYLPSVIVTEVLGSDAHLAKMPSEHRIVYGELLRWLEVPDEPRLDNIVARIKEVTAKPPTRESVKWIQLVFGHLAGRIDGRKKTPELALLKGLSWLSGTREPERWHQPNELHAVFQSYLFESQANFLDVDRGTQVRAGELLVYLQIASSPNTEQVVAHLLDSSSVGRAVNQEVYRFLNDNAGEESVSRLRNHACLLLADGSYVAPDAVFWTSHGFGQYRRQLGPDLRKYEKLFERLGVKFEPAWDDALKVLSEISDEFGGSNVALDDGALGVLMGCWKMLEEALVEEIMDGAELQKLQKTKCIPNVQRILVLPDLVFFEDRAGLASKFSGFLDQNTIPRPLGAGRAMAAAGVRALAGAVKVNLLECVDPTEDEGLAQRISERRLQLARVIEGQGGSDGLDKKLRILDRLRFERAETLRISFKISAFNTSRTSEPEDCPAFQRADQDLILFVAPEGRVPWTSIARELSRAVDPEQEAGRIAAGIKAVLAADSASEADSELDELGYATLASFSAPDAGDEGTIDELGGDTGSPHETEEEFTGGETRSDEDEPESGDDEEGEEELGGEEGDGKNEGDPGGSKGGDSNPPPGGEGNGSGGGGSGSGGKRVTRRGRLRSYVLTDKEPPEGDPDSSAAERRSEVDRGGVDKVLEFEKALGCIPEEQDHFNKGFDVISRDPEGNILRYIEVKSISGAWGGDGVKISPSQFVFGQEKGQDFWLYVVEHALDAEGKIHCIQNPTGKVDEFCFDDGWQDAAEKERRNMMPEEW